MTTNSLTLNHLNLVVSDVSRSARFYIELFGMEEQWSVGGEFVFLACGGTDLALTEGQPRMHPKFHFGFRLETRDAVDTWLARIREHGVPVTHGLADYGEYYTFTCRDPDGYGIEIYFEEGTPRGRTGFPEG